MSPNKPADDLDALRSVIEAVKDFTPEEQQRIFRWAAEKLGLLVPFGAGVAAAGHTHHAPSAQVYEAPHTHTDVGTSGKGTQDIKSFVAAKNPRSDVQFAATVAYYFQFEAPQSQRKSAISGEDLQEACRNVRRDRFKNPAQTLRNAHTLGLLDKAGEPGHFAVNTVGENLVAMTLPGDGSSNPLKRARNVRAKKAIKKASPGRKANKA